MLTTQQHDTFEALSPSSLKAIYEAAYILLTLEAMMTPTRSYEGRPGKPESRPPGDIRAATAHRRVLGRLWGAIGHCRKEINILSGQHVTIPDEYRRKAGTLPRRFSQP